MKFLILCFALIGMTLALARRPTPRPSYQRAQTPRPHHVPSYQRASVQQSDDIISKSYDLNPDGSYAYEYETANGISASENGVGGQYAKGAYEYTSPEGEHVVVQYTADENGFQPSGSHIPQIPPYILRALEYIRTHPHPEYQNY